VLPILLSWDVQPNEREWSPTGIVAFLECQRKWGFKKISKLDDPGGAGAILGKRSHSFWETYLGTGERPDFVKDKEAASIASLTLHLLPEPKTPGMTLERHFRFKSERTGFIYHGFKDFELPPGVPQPQLGLDGAVPIVGDHKTTSNIELYSKNADDLQWDAQAVLYGLDAMARAEVCSEGHEDCLAHPELGRVCQRSRVPLAGEAADLAWVYAQTKGAKRSKATVTRLHRAQALKVFDVIEEIAAEASAVLDAGLQPLDLPPTPEACRAFGGCPYQSLCNLSPSQKARSRMSNSLIANLRARVQGTPPSVQESEPSVSNGPSTEVDTKPSVMGCSDRDVPAPTEIPAALRGPSAGVNPPEGNLPAPQLAPTPVEEPKTPRTRRTKAQIAADAAAKDPLGADAHAHASHIGKMDGSSPERTPPPVTNPPPAKGEELSPQMCDGQATADAGVAKCGFTLYVDCIPTKGPRTVDQASSLIANAQERIAKELGAADYRLIDFGKGVPALIAFVDEQVDGTFDLTLDTRTPEGAVLLETLTAKAAFVVRGFR
jgi:hypothetical protein